MAVVKAFLVFAVWAMAAVVVAVLPEVLGLTLLFNRFLAGMLVGLLIIVGWLHATVVWGGSVRKPPAHHCWICDAEEQAIIDAGPPEEE